MGVLGGVGWGINCQVKSMEQPTLWRQGGCDHCSRSSQPAIVFIVLVMRTILGQGSQIQD
jgi:hypothetical protein